MLFLFVFVEKARIGCRTNRRCFLLLLFREKKAMTRQHEGSYRQHYRHCAVDCRLFSIRFVASVHVRRRSKKKIKNKKPGGRSGG